MDNKIANELIAEIALSDFQALIKGLAFSILDGGEQFKMSIIKKYWPFVGSVARRDIAIIVRTIRQYNVPKTADIDAAFNDLIDFIETEMDAPQKQKQRESMLTLPVVNYLRR